MATSRLLIDTNVFIGLEDGREVPPEFARLLELCQKHNVHVYVHEAAKRDIMRDKDVARRSVSLSKIKKFQTLKGQKGLSLTDLTSLFGEAPRPNDEVDLALLHSVHSNAVEFLVTQDIGIHSRARRAAASLDKRILFVADAVAWLRTAYEPREVRLPLIEEVRAHEISVADPIFESLRDGYPTFDKWWLESCVRKHRECWIATIDNQLAGLIVRKEETHEEAQTLGLGPKILKICTFKVKPEFRGEKLGEQFLKQIIWYAQRNGFDLVYLTTFAEQDALIRVLTYFGFHQTMKMANGELVFEKVIGRAALQATSATDRFELARQNYPRFALDDEVRVFCVPIKGEYHDILFPEMSQKFQGDLFDAIQGAPKRQRLPGNTIRKVYLCRAKTNALVAGSVLLFYRSKSTNDKWSQHITSVGVVEAVTEASDLSQLVGATGKRSVYSQAQLQEIMSLRPTPVKVIDFLLVGHFDHPMGIIDLLADGSFVGHPPQSICELSKARVQPLRQRMDFGFAL